MDLTQSTQFFWSHGSIFRSSSSAPNVRRPRPKLTVMAKSQVNDRHTIIMWLEIELRWPGLNQCPPSFLLLITDEAEGIRTRVEYESDIEAKHLTSTSHTVQCHRFK